LRTRAFARYDATMLDVIHGRRRRDRQASPLLHTTLLAAFASLACAGGDGSDDGNQPGTTALSITSAGTAASTGDDPTTTSTTTTTTGDPMTTAATSGPPPDTTTTSTSATTTTTTGEPDTTAGSSGGFESEYFMLADPLTGGTMGTPVGGAFGPEGWTVTAVADRIYWSVPRLVEGSVEFTIKNLTSDMLPLNDHEVFAMYEGGHGIEHPIGYSPEFRNNAYKSMIRIYGAAEGDRFGKQKIMWGMCPFGAGYHDGTCPCTDPQGFFEEPFGGDGTWDGSPQRLRVEWKDGITRFSRNGNEVLSIDWTASGLTFGPQELYVSLGNPRPEAVDTAAMPIGAIFADLLIEGWTGPEAATCQ
jgi:hypothetical protein